jgi:hypothetical protein
MGQDIFICKGGIEKASLPDNVSETDPRLRVMITYNYSDIQRYTSKLKYLIEIIENDIERFE